MHVHSQNKKQKVFSMYFAFIISGMGKQRLLKFMLAHMCFTIYRWKLQGTPIMKYLEFNVVLVITHDHLSLGTCL